MANLRKQGQGRFVRGNFLQRLREVVNVPHHSLMTATTEFKDTEHHVKLTRHVSYVSYVCGGVVDGIQHKNPQCEEDSLETLQLLTENSSQLRLLGNSLKSHLLRTEDMPAKLSPVQETRGIFVRARCRSPVYDWCGTSTESW